MTSFRKERVGDLVHNCIATQLREMHDPRLQLITVTEVQMTPDLKIAKVYISSMEEMVRNSSTEVDAKRDEAKRLAKIREGSLDALRHARNLLRKNLAQVLKLRFTPELHFYYDDSVKEGNRIEALLSSVRRGEIQ